MKWLFSMILVVLVQTIVLPQSRTNLDNLNAYRYVEVQPPFRGANNSDIIDVQTLRLTYYLEELLLEKGFNMVPRDSLGKTPTYGGSIPMTTDVQRNKCLSINIFWGFSLSPSGSELKLMAMNCRDEIILTGNYRMKSENDYENGFKKLLAPLLKQKYKFDEKLNHKLFLPQVEISKETESSLREYFSKGNLDPIEGIYKSASNEFIEDPASYKIGIKYVDNRYLIIVLETNNSTWSSQEVKGYFEKAENTELLPTTYLLSDKTKAEGFSTLNDLVLSISLRVEYFIWTGSGFEQDQKTLVLNYIRIFPK